MFKRIGPLAAPLYHLLYLSFIYLSTITKTHKKLPFNTCSYSLLKITCHYLLLLVGFDTLTYRKGCDRSPTLVGHQDHFLAPLPGSVALLVSEIGKETFILCVLFLFRCYSFSSLWITVHLAPCLWGTVPPYMWLRRLLRLLKLSLLNTNWYYQSCHG